MGYCIYIYIHLYLYIYIYSVKSKPPKLDEFRSLKGQTFFGRVDQPGCCDVRSPSRCRQTTLAAPFIPRRKTLLVVCVYIYIYVCGFIYVYMGFINIYMGLYGIYMGWSCLYDMGFSIVMGDPLYRWIVGWMGWMGWMQCQRNLGMALHKVVHKAREQNLQGRLIKRQWSNYIYIHINRLFFLLLGGFKYDSFWTFSKHIWDDVLPWPTFVWCV